MKKYIQISIRTKSETKEWGIGDRLIGSLENFQGVLLPEKISHNADRFTEPFLGKMASQDFWATPEILNHNGKIFEISQQFAWYRKKAIKSLGYVTHTMRNVRNQVVPGGVVFRSDNNEKVNFYSLFKEWCDIFPPQIGMLHFFIEDELKNIGKYDSFAIGSFNSALNPQITEMAWAMYYGIDFHKNIDFEKIEASGFFVEKVGEGYLVRVTESIVDIEKEFSLFSRRRAELKRLFPAGFFLNDGL